MYIFSTDISCCSIQWSIVNTVYSLELHMTEGKYSPDEVCDDEKLDDTVDDADGPALHYHWLGGFIGEEICYTGPHCSRVCLSLHTQSLCICIFYV